MLRFQIYNIPLRYKKYLQALFELLKNQKELVLLAKKNGVFYFEINFVTSQKIQEINLKYRNKNVPTDVLSFTYPNLGEIYICNSYIIKNAKDFDEDFLTELTRCIIHGCLHVLGYDHKKEFTKNTKQTELMYILQEQILKNATSSCLSKI